MIRKSINELNKKYDLELDKALKEIKKIKKGKILLQFADGLKPYATTIIDYLEENTKKQDIEFLIWFGDCFGACDTPVLNKETEKQINLLIQFGHNEMMPNY
ncbi:MAG: diphthamide synthesis protein [bacterium]